MIKKASDLTEEEPPIDKLEKINDTKCAQSTTPASHIEKVEDASGSNENKKDPLPQSPKV